MIHGGSILVSSEVRCIVLKDIYSIMILDLLLVLDSVPKAFGGIGQHKNAR